MHFLAIGLALHILQLNIEKLSATKHQTALEMEMSTLPSFQPELGHFTLP